VTFAFDVSNLNVVRRFTHLQYVIYVLRSRDFLFLSVQNWEYMPVVLVRPFCTLFCWFQLYDSWIGGQFFSLNIGRSQSARRRPTVISPVSTTPRQQFSPPGLYFIVGRFGWLLQTTPKLHGHNWCPLHLSSSRLRTPRIHHQASITRLVSLTAHAIYLRFSCSWCPSAGVIQLWQR
jgi:hypothetical protein